MTDWAAHRDEFPALATQAYLNTAAGAPMSRASAAAGRQYYEATERDGDVHWDDWLQRVEAVRTAAAGLLTVRPAEIAFVQNASAAMNLVPTTTLAPYDGGRRRQRSRGPWSGHGTSGAIFRRRTSKTRLATGCTAGR